MCHACRTGKKKNKKTRERLPAVKRSSFPVRRRKKKLNPGNVEKHVNPHFESVNEILQRKFPLVLFFYALQEGCKLYSLWVKSLSVTKVLFIYYAVQDGSNFHVRLDKILGEV